MIYPRSIFPLCLIALLFLFHGRSYSDTEDTDWESSPSGILAFADHLYEKSDYFRAIGEYKRFVYLFPTEPRVLQARFKMGVSYERSGHLDNAIEIFDGLLAIEPSSDVSHAVKYEIGKCFFLGRDYARSAEVLRSLGSCRSLALAGWALLKEGEYRESSESFALASKSEPVGYLSDLCASLSHESLKGDTISRKSVKIAALLSTPIPGAGRAYCGRLGDGVFSFLVVGGFYAGAYGYYRDEEYALSLGLMAFGLLFHAGDIYGAINSARLYNFTGEEAFVRSIENRHHLGGILLH
jgi:hypothetical protein